MSVTEASTATRAAPTRAIGKPTTSVDELLRLLTESRIGKPVAVTLLRGKKIAKLRAA